MSAQETLGTHALRRHERVRNQELRAEAQKRVREERARAEEERARQRSKAAKKAAETKRRLANAAANVPIAPAKAAAKAPVKAAARKLVQFRYGTGTEPPDFVDVEVASDIFWLRASVREFLLRFDKICRLPTRLTASVNDIAQPWVPEQMKTVCVALLRLVSRDERPLADVREVLAEIEGMDARDMKIWELVGEFLADFGEAVHTGDEEKDRLSMLQQLCVLCTGTEQIRLTITSDFDQLKQVEKQCLEEIKQVQQKLKATQQRLHKQKLENKQVLAERLQAAQRAADNKIFKAQQQLYIKQHKYNLRTAPLAVDKLGNRYWALQYKSAALPAWGNCVVCEQQIDLKEFYEWSKRFGARVDQVLKKRDVLVAEKKKQKAEARSAKAAEAKEAKTSEVKDETEKSEVQPAVQPQQPSNEPPAEATNPVSEATSEDPGKAVRRTRYPKLKIDFPAQNIKLRKIEGKENLKQLARWLAEFGTPSPEIDNVAEYLA